MCRLSQVQHESELSFEYELGAMQARLGVSALGLALCVSNVKGLSSTVILEASYNFWFRA